MHGKKSDRPNVTQLYNQKIKNKKIRDNRIGSTHFYPYRVVKATKIEWRPDRNLGFLKTLRKDQKKNNIGIRFKGKKRFFLHRFRSEFVISSLNYKKKKKICKHIVDYKIKKYPAVSFMTAAQKKSFNLKAKKTQNFHRQSDCSRKKYLYFTLKTGVYNVKPAKLQKQR